jgi:hypothetical protein
MARRGIALGGGLLILILLVLGVRGCLDARKERALKDYARDVSALVAETDQTSQRFFTRLEDPAGLSVTEFENAVNGDRSEMDGFLARVQSLDTPGDMGNAQDSLELVYQLRADALGEIAETLPSAFGDAGRERAIEEIAEEMRVLLAGDEVYSNVTQPEIQAVLADEGIEGDAVPDSQFLEDGIKWLDASAVDTALSGVSGSTGGTVDDGLIHGLGLLSASIDGVELTDGVPVTVDAGGTPQLDVQVQNQGEAEETGVTVTVTIDGGDTLEQEIGSIAPAETATVSIPLTPAPQGSVTLEVEVQPVPGEQVSDNNVASYPVTFE